MSHTRNHGGFGRTGAPALLVAATVCLSAGLAPVAGAATIQLAADLRGGQEVPAVDTTARGAARLILDTDANTLSYHIVVGSLSAPETAAHIHGAAAPGTNGGVKHTLPMGAVKEGTWDYDESDEAAILAGQMYINVHTEAHGGGEVRGQIGHFVADLNGFEAGTGSSGTGWATCTIDTDANELSYYIAIESLTSTETAAHFHGFALHGTSAGIVHPLAVGDVKSGTWSYAEDQEQAILDGRTYINIHTSAFGGGEIRGQVVRTLAPIDGVQVIPPVATDAHGAAYLALDPATTTLSYMIRYADLSSPETAAHIHNLAGILHTLPAGEPKLGSWDYLPGQEAGLLAGQYYINIHTRAHSTGELRGQLVFPIVEVACDADVDDDGTVGVGDLLAVLAAWGPCAGCPEDIDGDDMVGVGDLLAVLAGWGPCG